jgi:hypothetical protein
MSTKWNWLLDRLSENSTWRGIITLLTAAGVVLDPEKANSIIAAGLALVGVINVFRKAPPSAQAVAIAVNTGNTEHLVKPATETEIKP